MEQANGKKIVQRKPRRITLRLMLVPMLLGLVFYVSFSNFRVPTGSMESTVMAGDHLIVNNSRYQLSTPSLFPLLGFEIPSVPLLPAWDEPEAGDLIVFQYPGLRDNIEPAEFTYYLKRCVAVAGDIVELRKNQLHVNGNLVDPPAQAISDSSTHTVDSQYMYPRGTSWTTTSYGPLRVPAEGDVLSLDLDSITIGLWRVFIAREGHAVNIDHYNQTWVVDGRACKEYTVERDYLFTLGDNRGNSMDSRFWGFVPVDKVIGSPLMVVYSADPFTGDTRSERIMSSVD